MADTIQDQPKQSLAEVPGVYTPDKPGPAFDPIGLYHQYSKVIVGLGSQSSADNTHEPAADIRKPAADIHKPAAAPVDAGVQVCPASPDYEKYIDTAARYIYDPKDLGDISALDHKFDCDIHTTGDMFKYASLALSVTGDRFDYVMDANQAKQFERAQRGGYSGIGLEIVPAELNGMPNPMAAEAGPHPGGATVIKIATHGRAAEAAGLEAGDSFLKIDGKDVHSAPPEDISDAITAGMPGTKVDIVVDRHGQPVEKIVTRQSIESPPVVHDKDLGDGIAYIKIDQFGSETEATQLAAAMDKHKDAKGFIVDVRDNPGGLIDEALQSAELFVKDGTLMTSRIRHDSPPDKPVYDEQTMVLGKSGLTTTSIQSDTKVQTTNLDARLPYKAAGRPVVVLTNENSASASEIFTGAVHDSGHDTVVGTTTFGKGIGQYILKNLPDAGYLRVTSLHYLTPSGVWPGDADKHRYGLHPDIPATNMPDTVLGAPNDTQLNVAVDVLKKKVTGK